MLSTINLFLSKQLTSFQKFTDSSDCQKLIARNCALIFFKFRTGYGIVESTAKHAYNFLVSSANHLSAILQE